MPKAPESLRSAFRHEVRPDDYLGRVWATATIVALILAAMASWKHGQFDTTGVLPSGLIPDGRWTAHDPAGGLYVETWATILVNSMQAGFGLWGAVLIVIGFFRIFTAHKYVFACFSLGAAFIGFAFVLPSMTQALLKIAVEHYPLLVQ